MSYIRVIPRDLFNEASLLKCYGKLALELERFAFEGVELQEVSDLRGGWDIVQNQNDGSITAQALRLKAGGVELGLYRPLNSRAAWPMWCSGPDEDEDFDAIRVFNEDGSLSSEMEALLGAHYVAAKVEKVAGIDRSCFTVGPLKEPGPGQISATIHVNKAEAS